MKTVHILDYGTGNFGSLASLLHALGFIAERTVDPAVVARSPLVLLPGVGSAETAMRQLHERRLIDALVARHQAKRPILGICLGAQLVFSHLAEGDRPGLGFLPGTVARLPERIRFNTGWRRLDWGNSPTNGFHVGLRSSDTFFFNHQYAFPAESISGCVTTAGEAAVPAIFFGEHLCGIQFHPEKSQQPGRLLVRNVLRHYHGL